MPPQAIFTSFKLEKNENQQKFLASNNNNHHMEVSVFKSTSNNQLLDRVKIVQASEKCLEPSCLYDSMLHFHCSYTKACHFMTNYSSSMESHLEEFHENVKILERFVYFDRNFDCKFTACEYNKVTSHFHCLECQIGFAASHEMETHICRLPIKLEPESTLNLSLKNGLNADADENEKLSVVRAAGTFFPSEQNSDNSAETRPCSPSHCDRPFCKLKKKTHHHCELCNQAFTDLARLEIHVLKHQSTKLGLIDAERKRLEENSVELVPIPRLQSSSDSQEAQPQDLTKTQHPLTSPPPSQSVLPSSTNTPSMLIPPGFPADFSQLQNLHLAQLALQYPFYYQNPFMGGFPGLPGLPGALGGDQPSTSGGGGGAFPFGNPMQVPELLQQGGAGGTSSSNSNSNKRKSETEQAYELTNRIKIAKTREVPHGAKGSSSGSIKMFKDEPVPTGYLKFRFNEDCNFPNCGYRNHQSHFHCCRQDCFYSFCDKTRFVQHTARHERLDKLMGDDFKQFRANMRCGHDDCAYNKNLGEFYLFF